VAEVSPAARAWLVDLGITVAVAVITQIAIEVATEPHSQPAGLIGHLLGVAMALPLLFRRRWPAGALWVIAVVLLVYYSANFPGFPPTLILVLPLYFAVEAGRLRQVVALPLFFLAAGTVVGFRHGNSVLSEINGLLPHLGLLTVAILLGLLVRSRRALTAETQERLRLAADERDRETARRVAQERLRIARELHDTVAHAIATITVQSGTALHVLDARPDQARDALRAIRTTGQTALSELRATVGVLRDEHEGAAPLDRTAGLDRLPALLSAVRSAGLAVTVDTDGDPVPLPSTVDHAGYRILQEALTNVLRHAGPEATATVHIGYRPTELCLEVLDDGTGGGAGDGGTGHGLDGMRERAAALGGTVSAGPRGGAGGFAVRAALPLGAAGTGEAP
jgi:signal transduction histidine kinase